MHGIRDVALFLALGWLLLVALTTARAQEPTPEPTSLPYPRCFEAPGIQGATVISAGDGVQLTLPPGSAYQLLVVPPNIPQIYICHVESNSTLSIDFDCRETARSVGNPSGIPVLDQLLASCIPAAQVDCTGTYEGGQTIAVVSSIEITLPPDGQYGLMIPPPHDLNEFTVCHVGSQSSVTFLISSPCLENRRSVGDPSGAAILDAIADSCRMAPPPTPTPCSGDIKGGQPQTVGSITFTLPPGSYGVHTFPTADVIYSVTVCTTIDASTVRLSAYNCDETYREQYTSAAAVVLNEIVSSCRLTGPAPDAGIAPPATGSGGLVKT